MDAIICFCFAWVSCGIMDHLASIGREQRKIRKMLEKPLEVRMPFKAPDGTILKEEIVVEIPQDY
jgi:hypothetical protein